MAFIPIAFAIVFLNSVKKLTQFRSVKGALKVQVSMDEQGHSSTLLFQEATDNSLLTVLDADQKAVYRKKINLNTALLTLPLQNMDSGEYFLCIEGDGFSYTRKIVVK